MSAAVAPAAPDAGAQSAAALKTRFGPAVTRVWQSCGDTIAHVTRDKAHEAMAWLKNDPGQRFNYLVDITAVEYRDPERALEVVYNLRSIDRKAELRLKIELDKAAPLEVDSVYDLWRGADWLEREVFDMFGVSFNGHPDLRRILMWETYAEGFPLRKDFPLRGHFSRAEQTRQALAANPEAHYSLAELSIVDAYGELPADVRDRLDHGKRGTVE